MEYFGKVQKRLAYEASLVKQKIQLANTLKKASSQFTLIKDLINPFYMIGIPGSLHIMKLCAKYIPEYVNTVLVLNGMDEWEEEKARLLLSPKGIVRLNHSGVVPHGKVLDMLFRNMQNPFGIIDYDCFIFNAGIFNQITSLEPDVIVNSLFSKESPVFGKTPQTFFCFFQTEIVRSIIQKYKVNCGITSFSKRIPKKAGNQLHIVGINEENYPEAGKNYFDTLRLVISLGISEGYRCNYLNNADASQPENLDAFHVGGVAEPNSTYGWWAVRGSYFWWRALETCEDEEIVFQYHQKYGNRKSSEIFDGFSEYRNQTKQSYFDIIERIVSQP